MRRTTLPNGLQVVTEHMPASRTFSVGVFAGVGSRHETPALHGASHFLEHVLFKGTARRSAEEISAAVEAVGGELNAYTTKEYTCFYARVLQGDAALAVDVLTDMITASTITGSDLDAERAVIQDEIAMHADDPGEVVQEVVAGHVFAGSGLGRTVIGSPGSIADLTRDQVVRHWRRHYGPSSLVVAAAGHVDHDRLVEQLASLDARPHGPARRPPKATAVNSRGGLVTAERRVEQVSAVLGYPSPGLFDDARYALGLLSLVLGGGMSSRLFVEVRERRGLTYGIDAGETTYSDAGLWSVDWQCAPNKLAPIVDLVRATLAEVAEHGVTEAELARAQGQMRGQTVLSYESPSSRMSRLGGNTVLGDQRDLAEVLDRFDAVDAGQVQAAAATLFSQQPVLGLVGPRVPAKVLRDWSS
ncbi:Predicted Zn-dependent peptidase [Friedmanniella luteola]|uniref:Predicted Zn-dependent peptidase n=1 Tax=Friedmanniella luteola TaxID=546871 RepID=A0A1H1Q711_9ACTN|nr:pitrilysin family protein [Friedmanniella luteola]SDS19057.1 Predicted Zn-dependent peptidase [Friedmanniella luteola]